MHERVYRGLSGQPPEHETAVEFLDEGGSASGASGGSVEPSRFQATKFWLAPAPPPLPLRARRGGGFTGSKANPCASLSP
jgi:hypothetical protein